MGLPVSKEDIIRIEMIDKPEKYLRGEGLYEWRYMDIKYYLDILDVEKEINQHMPGKGENILDRLYNFRKVYMNIKTGEVST